MKIAVSPSNGWIVAVLVGRAFEQAQAGGADRDDPPAGRAHGVQPVGGGGVDPAPFGVHHMVGGVVGLDRQEGARADMERQRFVADPGSLRAPPSASGVKCSAAVGAATAPSLAANIVW